MILKKQLGARVRAYRKKANLTQAELAAKIRLSVNMVGYIERGERFPSPETFEKLADSLGVNLSDLFLFPPPGCEADPEKKTCVVELQELIKSMPTSSVKSVVKILSESKRLWEAEMAERGLR